MRSRLIRDSWTPMCDCHYCACNKIQCNMQCPGKFHHSVCIYIYIYIYIYNGLEGLGTGSLHNVLRSLVAPKGGRQIMEAYLSLLMCPKRLNSANSVFKYTGMYIYIYIYIS